MTMAMSVYLQRLVVSLLTPFAPHAVRSTRRSLLVLTLARTLSPAQIAHFRAVQAELLNLQVREQIK